MKRCPECRRDYYDDSLAYCLDDGTPLLEGPSTADPGEQGTALLSGPESTTALLNSRDCERVEHARHGSVYRALLAATSAVIIIGAGVIAVYEYRLHISGSVHFASGQDIKISKLTDSGRISDIAISPDGRYVAYVQSDNGKKSIRLRQTATTSDVEIVSPVETDLLDLSFSRDGNYLYYVDYIQNGGTLYEVPALGGPPRKILFNIDSRAAVSHDGKQIAFVRFNTKGGSAMLLANADGTNERTLIGFPDAASSFIRSPPSWSPDDRSLVCPNAVTNGSRVEIMLYSFSAADGSRSVLNDQEWDDIRDVEWLSSGDVVVAGNEKSGNGSGTRQLWLVTGAKAPTRITNDLSDYKRISSTSSGDTIATIQDKRVAGIWVMPDGDSKKAQQAAAYSDLMNDVQMTPDGGKVIFNKRTGAGVDIFVMNSDGSEIKQLTQNQGYNDMIAVSPDGHFIVFRSDRDGTAGCIFRMNIDGTGTKQLDTTFGAYPGVSPDGQWVIFVGSDAAGGPTIEKISINGGEPTQLSGSAYRMSISPKDASIAEEVAGTHDEEIRRDLVVVPQNGGEPIFKMTLPTTIGLYDRIMFMPDGRSLVYIDTRNGSANLWTIPLTGKPESKPLTSFTDQRIFAFGWSADGHKLAVIRGNEIQDAVLLTDNRAN